MNSWIHMMVGRFVAGLGLGNLSVGVPMYQSESAPREIRGAVVASYQLMITVGILAANGVCCWVRSFEDSSASWRFVVGIGMLVAMPTGLCICIVPESPRWLAGKGDWDRARISVSRLRGPKHDSTSLLVENDLHEMREVLSLEEQAGKASWLECFSTRSKVPKTLYRTLLGMSVHFFQQWTGINYFFYYSSTIFGDAIQDPFLMQIILGSVNFAMTLYSLYVVDRLGRRWPLIIGSLWQAIWLVVFATVGILTDKQEVSDRGHTTILIVSACMFIASFAGTWGPVPWVVIGETFTLRTRAKQASLATCANWIGNFIIGLVAPYADMAMSYGFGFILAGTNIIAALVIWLYLYESRALSLESIDLMYSQDNLKVWKSSGWVPPGYITRLQRDESQFRRVSLAGMGGLKSQQEENSNKEDTEQPPKDVA